MVNVADWVGQKTATTGRGIITLGDPIDGFAPFSALPNGEVYYTIADGFNRESGIGTLSGTAFVRTAVVSTLVDSIFDNSSPVPINLSGNALVFSTYNSRTHSDLYDAIQTGSGALGQPVKVVQSAPSAVWTVNHNLGYNPQVQVYGSGGIEVSATVTHTSTNQFVVNFVSAFAGFTLHQ